jgi:glycosyltransferase involved in cell wall biosynthesis
MRLVTVFHAPPYPPDLGPSRRHYHVLEQLAARHDVSVVSFGTDADRRLFDQHFGDRCEEAVFVPRTRSRVANALEIGMLMAARRSHFGRLHRPRFQHALDRLLRQRTFDAVYLSTTMLGGYRFPPGVPLVGDTHNVEHDSLRRAAHEAHELWRRAYFARQAVFTAREERRYTTRCSVVCATSPRDRGLIELLAPDVPVHVVPNGIDLDRFAGLDRNPRPHTLLFTGLMSYYPNVHAVTRLLTRIFPRVLRQLPDARVKIVGASPSRAVRELAGGCVEVTGFVPDVRPYLSSAAAFVIPLAMGGGTRVKALEAMAAGVPVVSTTIGCEGLDVENGRSVLLADDDEQFAAAVVRVLTNRSLAEGLATAARETAKRYDWRLVGRQLDTAIHDAIAVHRTASIRVAYALSS